MSESKNEKIKSAIKNAAAVFLQRESGKSSLITVTDASMSRDEKRLVIFFTCLPEDKEDDALEFMKRKRSEFREFVKDTVRIGRIPFFDFDIDRGEKNRQKIDKISLLS
jgi:ribosome-binding factor A